jgi:hypothetical protein
MLLDFPSGVVPRRGKSAPTCPAWRGYLPALIETINIAAVSTLSARDAGICWRSLDPRPRPLAAPHPGLAAHHGHHARLPRRS